MTNDPIFRNVSQALHVSYLMQVLPIGQPSWMQKMIDDHMRACGVWDEAKPHDRTINFGGMSSLDIRAECANVTKRVDEWLKTSEAGAIKAWYGHQKTKVDGVQAVFEYVLPMFDIRQDATKAIVWSLFAPKAQSASLSPWAIHLEYEVTRHRVIKNKQEIQTVWYSLLQNGTAELEKILENARVIDPI
jgi:hypothetical protein